jgi:hypothetical protein
MGTQIEAKGADFPRPSGGFFNFRQWPSVWHSSQEAYDELRLLGYVRLRTFAFSCVGDADVRRGNVIPARRFHVQKDL